MTRVRLAGRAQLQALLIFAGLVLCLHSGTLAQEEANPGRPTVSTPATLTPVGYLQFESGLLGAEASGEFANRTSIQEVVKLSVAQRLEFLVQTEPLVQADIGNAGTLEPGDVSAGLQVVVVSGKERRPTISVSYFHSVYSSSAPDLDIGSTRQSGVLLVSFDLGKFHVDTNGIVGEQIDDRVHRAQFGQTLSVSRPVYHQLGLTAEFWHFSQPFLKGNAAGFLFAPTYSLRKNLVLDAGFNRGLTTSSTRWEVFAGFTYLLPRKLWGTRKTSSQPPAAAKAWWTE